MWLGFSDDDGMKKHPESLNVMVSTHGLGLKSSGKLAVTRTWLEL